MKSFSWVLWCILCSDRDSVKESAVVDSKYFPFKKWELRKVWKG
jgi:hypothetical protein